MHRLYIALANDQTTSVFLPHFGSLLGCFLTVSSMLWDAWLTFLISFNLAVCGDIVISFHQKQNYCGTKVLVLIVKALVIYVLLFLW